VKNYKDLGHVIIGTTLRNLAEQVSKDAENIYDKFNFDIDIKWFPVFYVLASKESDSVVNIAKEIKQSHVSVSKIIKEMKVANLINSHKSEQDSRITLITLNDRAKAMIPAMEKQCEAVDAVMVGLTRETGIDLWQAVSVTQRHLEYRTLSSRLDEKLTDSSVRFVDYAPKDQAAFKALNVEWISQHFTLEQPDIDALDNPEHYILSSGGTILIAIYNNIPVGCCALIKMNDNTYELAKMAVSPTVQGKGFGLLLGQKIIERAKLLGAKRLYLESNSALESAIRLYIKLGFEHITAKKSPYARCDVQMELCLNN